MVEVAPAISNTARSLQAAAYTVLTATVGGQGQASTVSLNSGDIVRAFLGEDGQSSYNGGDGYSGGGGATDPNPGAGGRDGDGGENGSRGSGGLYACTTAAEEGAECWWTEGVPRAAATRARDTAAAATGTRDTETDCRDLYCLRSTDATKSDHTDMDFGFYF